MARTIFDEDGKDETVCDGSPAPICKSGALVETLGDVFVDAVLVIVGEDVVVSVSEEDVEVEELRDNESVDVVVVVFVLKSPWDMVVPEVTEGSVVTEKGMKSDVLEWLREALVSESLLLVVGLEEELVSFVLGDFVSGLSLEVETDDGRFSFGELELVMVRRVVGSILGEENPDKLVRVGDAELVRSLVTNSSVVVAVEGFVPPFTKNDVVIGIFVNVRKGFLVPVSTAVLKTEGFGFET